MPLLVWRQAAAIANIRVTNKALDQGMLRYRFLAVIISLKCISACVSRV